MLKNRIAALVLIPLVAFSGCQSLAGLPAPSPKPAETAGEAKPGAAQAEPPPQAYTAKLSFTPAQAEPGATVEVTGSEYPPGAEVDLVWYTFEGRYETDGGEFVGQRYQQTSRVLTKLTADGSGKLTARLEVPVDFGGPHDLRGRVNGREVSQAGLVVMPSFSITPQDGPVGTPIEVRVAGVEASETINSWQILYDNHYVGVMSAVTTKGVAIARFRAAGPVGERHISVWHNSIYPVPFLNYKDGAFKDVPGAEFTFRVTADRGPGEPVIETDAANGNPFQGVIRPGGEGSARLTLSADRVAVGQRITLQSSGLPANAKLTLRWGTPQETYGERGASGQVRAGQMRPAGEVQSGADGSMTADLAVPNILGGVHRLEVAEGQKALVWTFLYVQPSLVAATPTRVRAGEEVKIHLNGLGSANSNNGIYALTYDNSYIGYICGSTAGGDVTFTIRATGGPGTHLIDLYPFVYKSRDQAKDQLPRVYGVPQLSYAADHPWRTTPAIRLAFEIVP